MSRQNKDLDLLRYLFLRTIDSIEAERERNNFQDNRIDLHNNRIDEMVQSMEELEERLECLEAKLKFLI